MSQKYLIRTFYLNSTIFFFESYMAIMMLSILKTTSKNNVRPIGHILVLQVKHLEFQYTFGHP